MGKNISSTIIAAVFVFGGTAGLLLFAHNEPSTQALDGDLTIVHAQLADAAATSAKYQGGLIKTLIELRSEILRTTEAMLQQKRSSLIRRIDLSFTVNASPPIQSPERLHEIEKDIRDANAKIAKDEMEALRKGGLIQGLALMTVETERLALAHLYVGYYDEKYGIKLPTLNPNKRPGSSETIPPASIVKDKDAL